MFLFKKNIYIKSIDDLKNHYYNTSSDESNVVLKFQTSFHSSR